MSGHESNGYHMCQFAFYFFFEYGAVFGDTCKADNDYGPSREAP
jgi:hypothetical protein